MTSDINEIRDIIERSELSSKGFGHISVKGTPEIIAAHLSCIIKTLLDEEVLPKSLLLESISSGLSSLKGDK